MLVRVRASSANPVDAMIREDFVEACRHHTDGAGADAVLDTVGGPNVARSLNAACDGGRVATVLAPEGRLDDLYQRNQTLYGIFLSRERLRLTEMTPLFDRGQVRPLVAQTFDLDQIVDVHRRLDDGHNAGKLIVETA